jgi:type IV pilus assembly protein PilA
MTLIQAYLKNPHTSAVLSKKPGDQGFSLIELVVVVAVLAVLSAIAIPAFTNISEQARASAAANTVATIAKECAVKNNSGGGSYNVPSLNGYSVWQMPTGTAVTGSQTCPSSGTIKAVSSDETKYPSFSYDVGTGAKVCATTTNSAAATNRGCTGTTW